MGRLEAKRAVVLGAAGRDNIGQTIARALAAEGAWVMVAGRAAEPLETLATEIGGAAHLVDMTSKADVEALASSAQAGGPIDIAINCTGQGLLVPSLETTEAQLDQLLALQFKGVFFFLQAFTSRMRDRPGSIIQISSASVTALLDNHAAYIGTKGGTDHVIRCFANEFGAAGLKFNSIAPGLTATPMTAAALAAPGLEDAFRREYPLGRVGTAADVAAAAVWLASDESFVSGQVLQVNGGLTLRRNPNQAEINASIGAAIAAMQSSE